jgi:hypothetical protein
LSCGFSVILDVQLIRKVKRGATATVEHVEDQIKLYSRPSEESSRSAATLGQPFKDHNLTPQ